MEWVLLALVGLPIVSSRRIDRYQLAHVLVWLHLALVDPPRPALRPGGGPGAGPLLDGLPLAMRRSWKRDGVVDLAGPGDARPAGGGGRGVWLGGF